MILGVIPARYASTRFPGKPLTIIRGKTMIERVYERCQQSQTLADTVVATDDIRIYDHVVAFGGKVVMTLPTHQSGTERMTEVAQNYSEFEYFINIQGDEPFIDPGQIDMVGNLLKENPQHDIATLAIPLRDQEKINNPDNVKVVFDHQAFAMYFSRSVIPYPRNEGENLLYYKHIGIYGFRRDTLLKVPGMPPSVLEQTESLEQLRWLANGFKIKVGLTDRESISVDTPDDLSELE